MGDSDHDFSFHRRMRELRRPDPGAVSRLPGIVYQARDDRVRTMEFLEGAVTDITGYRPEQLLGNRDVAFRELIHPDDRERAMEAVRWQGDDPHLFQVEYRITARDGTPRWVWDQGHGVFAPGGELLGLEGFIADVSPLKAALEEAEASNRLLRTVLEQSLVGNFALQDGRFVHVNEKLGEILDVGAETLDDRTLLSLLVPEHRPLAEERIQDLLEGRTDKIQVSVQALGSDGRILDLEIHGARATIDGHSAVIGTVLDMTERRLIQRQYREAQKLEAVARMASGIAHDFNNLLTAITGTARLAIERISGEGSNPDPEAALSDFEDILGAARQEALLTRQLLAFSRRGGVEATEKREVVDLRDVVREAEGLIQRIVGDPIDVQVRMSDRVLPVSGDLDQLQQILLNLVVNADDAMPRGGTLTVSVHEAAPEDLPQTALDLDPDGAWACLSVVDVGPGVPENLQEKIFEPFFTTKERGKGTGLGLSTAYGIVRDHGGVLSLDPEEETGAAFRIHLPLLDAASTVSPASKDPGEDEPVGGNEVILLVDDDDAVRRVMARTLVRHGYEVLEAGTPGDAMAVGGQNADRIDLLVSDVGLPQMRGSELAGSLKDLVPDLSVLLISGYAPSELEGRGVDPGAWSFLPKPFTPGELAARVREILDAGEHPRDASS